MSFVIQLALFQWESGTLMMQGAGDASMVPGKGWMERGQSSRLSTLSGAILSELGAANCESIKRQAAPWL
ncbi:hypothetical protein CUC44_18470 [Aeromonas lusitana]|uniref:Uncharacterized protein n=1 Tax=Aeromonas lusitana TaxID=931529 RepID=A0A2M8H5P3_9GAMM|nr:hypothetical protein CUC44_18470 [Aeromonas lusitana]